MANRDFEMELKMKADFQSADRASERTVENIQKISDAAAQANTEMGTVGAGTPGPGAGVGDAQQATSTDALTASLGRNAQARQAVEQASRATQQAVAAEMGLIRDLQQRLETGAGSFEDLADTERMLDRAMARGLISAEEYDAALVRLNGEQARLTREGEKSGKAIDATAARYDKAGAALKRLQADEARLNDARDRGRISLAAYDRAMAGIASSRVKWQKASEGVDLTNRKAGALNVTLREVRTNLATAASQLAQGNITSAGNSLLNLGARGAASFGALSLAIGGVAAAVALLAVATVAGEREQARFQRSILSTGNILGSSAEQLAEVRDQAVGVNRDYGKASTAAALLAESGKVASDSLAAAASAAVSLSDLTGESIESTTAKIISLAAAPSQQLAELNEKYHFLTLEVYEHVKSLEDQGRSEDAAREAIEAFAEVHEFRVKQAYERAAGLARAWLQVKGNIAQAFQDIKKIGNPTIDIDIAETSRKLAAVRSGSLSLIPRYLVPGARDEDIRGLTERLKGLQAQKTAIEASTQSEAEGRRVTDEAIAARSSIDKRIEDGLDRQSKKQKALNDLRRQYVAIDVASKGTDPRLFDGSQERLEKAIEKQFKEPKQPKAKKTDAQRAEESAKGELDDLKQQVALLDDVADGQDKASTAALIRYKIESGAYKGISEALKQQLVDQSQLLDSGRADAEEKKKQAKAQEELKRSYEQLREALRTPAEISLDTAISRIKVLDDYFKTVIGDKANYDQAMGRVVSSAFDKPPQFEGLAPEVGGAKGEIDKTFKAQAELEKWYSDQLTLLAQFRQQRSDLNAQWDSQEQALTLQHQNALKQIESARRDATLQVASDFFGQMSQLQSSENSKVAAIGKAAAIAQAMINTYQAATAAYSSLAAIPYVGPALGAAAAAAAIAAGLANVAQIRSQQTSFATGGHVRGPGTGSSDSIDAHLSDYEFVTRAGVVRQPGALPFLEDFNARGMAALSDWQNYASGGLVAAAAPRPISAPDWGGMQRAGAGAPTVSNRMRVYLLQDQDQLAQHLANHPAMEKAVVAIAGRNGRTIKAEW